MRRSKGWRLPNELTSRQREALQLWEAGLRQAEIARRLSMSRATVLQHLRYAKAKAVKRHLEITAAPVAEPVAAGG